MSALCASPGWLLIGWLTSERFGRACRRACGYESLLLLKEKSLVGYDICLQTMQADPVERPCEGPIPAETAWKELCASIAALHVFIDSHSLCCSLDVGALPTDAKLHHCRCQNLYYTSRRQCSH